MVLMPDALLHAQSAAPELPNPGTPNISRIEQRTLGLQAASEVYQYMPLLPDSSPETQYIRRLGQKLEATIPSRYSWPFAYHVVAEKGVNANALPGGQVFVNSGTITTAANEAELAGIMAHEMAHVYMQHSAKRASEVTSGIAQAVLGETVGGMAAEMVTELERLGIQVGRQGLVVKYSREDESEADAVGAVMLYKAGYRPRAMVRFFNSVESTGGRGARQWLRDHPDPGNRAQAIERETRNWPPVKYATYSPDFRKARLQTASLTTYTSEQVAEGAQSGQWATYNSQNGATFNPAAAPSSSQGPGANVNEGLETAFLWVDANSGSDTNPGTQAQPLKTIGAAVSIAMTNNTHSVGTQINVNPGTYRESITMSSSSKTTAYPITIQATTAGKAIVSGAVVQSGWTTYGSNPSIYTSTWTNNWGLCAQLSSCLFQPDIMMRREMIIVNGTPLTQVLSQSQMQAGTFYVDQAGNLAYIWPAAGTNINTATVEVATLPSLLNIYAMQGVVIRGMVFQYANSCHANAAVFVTSTNTLIDNDTFQWNNGQGLAFNSPATNFTVQYTLALHNGDSGFQESQTKYGLWQTNVTSYNNWRGAQGAYYYCNVAGLHAWEAHNDVNNNLNTSFNQTYGAHWDTDGNTITNSTWTVVGNLLSGLFVEKAEGPVSFDSTNVCNQTSNVALGGLQLRNSTYLSLTNNVFNNNARGSIFMTGQPGGLSVTNWETGQNYNLVSSYLTMTGNTIVGSDATQQVFYNNYLGGSDWTSFQTTLTSNNNTWWNPAATAAFTIPYPANATVGDLPMWQSATGQGSNSTFSAPGGNATNGCAVVPSGNDFWFTSDNGSLNTDPSGQATFNLTMTPLNFTGSANLVLDGVSEVKGLSATLTPTTIAPSGTSVLAISAAKGTAPGTYPITVLATSGNTTHTATMSLTVPTSSLYFSTVSLNMGSAQTKTTGSSQNVTITNTGTTAVSITSVVSNSNAFTQTNTCGSSLGAGKNCTITVTFSPNSVGVINSYLTVTDNDPTSPQTVNLTGTGLAAPSLSFSPSPVTFPDQQVAYTSAPLTVTLTNAGSGNAAPLTITSITLTGSKASDYAITANTCPVSPNSLNGGASCTVTLTFTPGASGTRNATLTVADNSGGNNQETVTVTGNGILPTTTLTPSSLSFGDQLVNNTSPSQAVTYTNSSSSVLTINSVTLTGTNPSNYSQTNTCPGSLAVGANCTITVTFTPSTSGSRTANVTISNNTSTGSDVLALTGTGVYPTVSFTPASLTFAAQTVGTTSPGQTVTLTNTGSVQLNITNYSFTGSNPGDFAQTHTCGASVAASGTCNITITFTPGASGSRTASLKVSDNSSGGSDSFGLTGTGGTPTASFSTSPLAFGTVQIATSKTLSTVLSNSSTTVPLSVTGVTLTGAYPGDYSQTNNCPATLNVGATCTITVTFTPGATSSRNATLTVNDNVSGGSSTDSLTGTGAYATASASPSSLSFGSQQLNTTSVPMTTTLTNTSSIAANLNINSIAISGANASEYVQTNTCPATLAQNATCTITATFTPTGTGSRTATVTVSNNTSSGSTTINLTGTGAAAKVTLSPTSLSFGTQPVGGTSTAQVVTVNNVATTSQTISSITMGGANPGDFAQTNNCGTSLAASSSCSVSVTFTPSSNGTRTANLTVTTGAGSEIATLSGTGGATPTVSVSPSSVTFSDQGVGTSSGAQAVTISNTGTVALNISSILVNGANAGDFAQTNNCGATLAASANCTVSLIFSPSASGTRTGTLTISDNASPATQTVSLSGNGTSVPTVTVSPASVTFPDQAVGTTSDTQLVTISNTGTVVLNKTSILLSGGNRTDFAQTNNCGATLAAGASCTVSVTFTPSASGSRSTTLTITDNASPGTQTVPLSGNGTSVPTVTVSPSSVAFPDQTVGTTGSAQNVTMSNTGTVALSITSIVLSGANSGDFAQTNTCGSSLAAGANCTVSVTFTPSATGSRSTSLTITDNASPATQTVSLSGNGTSGPTVTVSPASVTFPDQTVGTASGTQVVTMSNTGSVVLNKTSILLSGGNRTDFAQTNNCGATLAAGANCTVSVTFTPSATGSRSTSLTITDDASPGTQTVPLSGNGALPSAGLTPASVTFADQAVGTTSSAQIATLNNSGTVPLTISSIAISGATDFTQTNNCGSSLAPGSSCSISVSFTPSSVGAKTATVVVTDNDPSGTQSVSLSGNGATPSISLSPTSLFFGTVGLGTSGSKLVTVSNTGTVALSVNNVTMSGANPGDFSQTNNCSGLISPSGACSVTVTFTPQASSQRTATLNVYSNASGVPSTVSLTGTGGAPTATLTPTTDAFGTVAVGTTSAAVTNTLTNTSTNGAILAFSGVTITGTNPGDFSQTNNCPAGLVPSASCTITVTFSPTTTGSRSATLNALINTPSGSKSTTLSGTGK
jgi:hypothetical protein